MELLREATKLYSLERHFYSTKVTIPPHSFIYPKNKSTEWDNNTKFRISLSHFAYPVKVFGRNVGRALSFLIHIARDVLPTWAR